MMSLAFQYLHWHYSVSLASFRGIFENIIWFLYNLFSLELMVKTLFVPFRRLKDRTQHRGLDMSAISEELVVNTLMRLVGFLMRSFLICVGVSLITLVFLSGAFFFVVWLLAPIFLAMLVTTGITLVIFI